MDGELGVDWIKHFDHYTKAKAAGGPRLLVVDQHRSRLSLPFLLFCRENNIHVACYPSHSTHIYQGLDTVCFGVLKREFSKEMLKFESENNTAVCKSNFLRVYGPAHLRAFTPENVKMAFAKTGIYPFNPDVITPTAMNPSIESSRLGDGLPLPQPSPIKVVANLLKRRHELQNTASNQLNRAAFPSHSTISDENIDPVLLAESQAALQDLSQTSAAFLVSQSPIKASAPVPFHLPPQLPPPIPVPNDLLSHVPSNLFEERMQEMLITYIKLATEQYATIARLQANLVLQNVYCERLRSQLNAKEKAANAPKGTGRLAVDGLPRCLTSDEFVEKVREFVERQLAEATEKERKKKAREDYSAAMREWTRLDRLRIESNKLLTAKYKADVMIWEAERDLAKREKRRARWNKPKKGKLPGPAPKPQKPQQLENAPGEVEDFTNAIEDAADDASDDDNND